MSHKLFFFFFSTGGTAHLKKICDFHPARNSDAQHSENLQGDISGVSTNLFLIPFIDLLGFKHLKVTKLICPNSVINAF